MTGVNMIGRSDGRKHGAMGAIVALAMLALGGCGGGGGQGQPAPQGQAMAMFVPLYIWPDTANPNGAWRQVANAASLAPVTAVINPNSGPVLPVPQAFLDGIRVLQAAGVRVLGYVPTGFGARAESAIHADMDAYLRQYGVDGIFLDEVETTNPARFSRLCSHAGAGFIVLNPGAAFPNAYLSGFCPAAVVFENTEQAWQTHRLSAENATLAPAALIALVHSGVPDPAAMAADLDHARALGVAGVFVTDRPFGPNTWNTLPSYFSQEAARIGTMRVP